MTSTIMEKHFRLNKSIF